MDAKTFKLVSLEKRITALENAPQGRSVGGTIKDDRIKNTPKIVVGQPISSDNLRSYLELLYSHLENGIINCMLEHETDRALITVYVVSTVYGTRYLIGKLYNPTEGNIIFGAVADTETGMVSNVIKTSVTPEVKSMDEMYSYVLNELIKTSVVEEGSELDCISGTVTAFRNDMATYNAHYLQVIKIEDTKEDQFSLILLATQKPVERTNCYVNQIASQNRIDVYLNLYDEDDKRMESRNNRTATRFFYIPHYTSSGTKVARIGAFNTGEVVDLQFNGNESGRGTSSAGDFEFYRDDSAYSSGWKHNVPYDRDTYKISLLVTNVYLDF